MILLWHEAASDFNSQQRSDGKDNQHSLPTNIKSVNTSTLISSYPPLHSIEALDEVSLTSHGMYWLIIWLRFSDPVIVFLSRFHIKRLAASLDELRNKAKFIVLSGSNLSHAILYFLSRIPGTMSKNTKKLA